MRMRWQYLGLWSLLLSAWGANAGPNQPGATTAAVSSPPTGRIVYVSTVSGNPDIWVQAPGGSATNVTNDPRQDYQPAWSPDGSRIAFSRVENDASQNIWVMNADGSDQHRLNAQSCGDPRWSPDGTKIACTGFLPGFVNLDVYVMDADGGHVYNLTSDSAVNDYGPDWSPDGTTLVFSSSRLHKNGRDDLFLMSPDGSNVRLLASVSGSEFYAKWSPDGQRLLFTHSSANGLWTINADGSNIQRILNTSGLEYWGAWSPDGEWIAFVKIIRGRVNVYLIRADGTDEQRLTEASAFEFTPDWTS